MLRIVLLDVWAFAVFALVLPKPLLCVDQGFDGKWDITTDQGFNQRVWWMEIQGSRTPQMRGRFTGFWGGDTNDIKDPHIENGVLKFNSDLGRHHQEYVAHLENTKDGERLIGEMRSAEKTVHWTGARAPQIDQHDDGTWKPGKTVALFNGKDLSDWHGRREGHRAGWSVENNILKCTGSADDLISLEKFWNFDLHIEYRILPNSNSGIALRGRYEVQIIDDSGKPPNLHSNGSLYSRIAPAVNASKPTGEWQTYDVRLVGLDVTVVLNGRKVIDKGHIDGLTAMAFDADESRPGPLGLQGDHGPVEFRAISVTPLER
jgi:hypothetical protein